MKPILTVAFVLVLAGCALRNEEAASVWIKQAPKPIVVRRHTLNVLTNHWDYTLIAADGTIYRTGDVGWELPDTLRGPNERNLK